MPQPQVFDIKSILSSLKTKHNISDDELNLDALAKQHEEFIADRERLAGLRQSDYDSKFNKSKADLEAEKQKIAEQTETLQRYENFLVWLENDRGWGPRENWNPAQIAMAREQNPNGNGGGNSAVDTATIEKMLKERDDRLLATITAQANRAVDVSTFMLKADRTWRNEFKEDFPEEDFGKFYSEGDGRGLPFDAALKLFMQPKVDERQKKTFEDQIKEAELRGFQRGQSQFNSLEPDAAPSSLNPMSTGMSFLGNVTDSDDKLTEEQRSAKHAHEIGDAVRQARQRMYGTGPAGGSSTGT